MKSVLGLGNALVDILATVPDDVLLTKYSLPKGSMQHVDEITGNNVLNDLMELGCERIAGGSAANTINGIARLGLNAGFIGKTGNDDLSLFFNNDQEKSGVKPQLLKGSFSTGRAMVLISDDAERTFAVYLGAAIELNANDLKEEMFNNYNCFHIEGYLVQNHDLVKRAVQIAKSKGMTISIDMASYNVVAENKEFLDGILRNYIDIVFANEDEARVLTGKEPEEALDEISKICPIAVVKIGKKGSLVKSKNNSYQIQPIEATPIDATGAGDLYASGFLYGFSQQLSLDKCGAIGSLCSGKVVEVIGPKMSDERWNIIKEEVKRIMR